MMPRRPRPGDTLACGHVLLMPDGIATGYALSSHDDDAPAVCYACADVLERVELATTPRGGTFIAYVSGDGKTVTTWTGGYLARVVGSSYSRRGAFGGLHYWTVKAPDGRRFHGRNSGNGMAVRLHPSATSSEV